MTTDTEKRIIEYIKENKEVMAKELVDYLGIGPRAVFKQLKKLRITRQIAKSGTPPKVFYFLPEIKLIAPQVSLTDDIAEKIKENYFAISPQGAIQEGVGGFSWWCEKQGMEVVKTASEYIETLKKYETFKKDGYINGIEKFRQTFSEVFLDEIYYLDFYSIERFGKTKLGTMLLYAKQSGNRGLIKRIVERIREPIARLIGEKQIDAIGFVPPTIYRPIQMMKELEKMLDINLPKVKIVKAISGVPVAQKSLSKLSDRVENAAKTIFIDDKRQFQNILLIDDAVGSGATFNEVARKIRNKGLVKGKIIGLAITGSFKGFEVISEV